MKLLANYMGNLKNAQDLKSLGLRLYEFKSRPGYHGKIS